MSSAVKLTFYRLIDRLTDRLSYWSTDSLIYSYIYLLFSRSLIN